MENNSLSFKDLKLSGSLLESLQAIGYKVPTQIQAMAIPEILNGRDVLACAQTGTGKTAAFSLPILDKLQENPKFVESGEFRALILAPTRELVEQIHDNIKQYAKSLDLKSAKIYGGVSQNQQIRALEEGLDLLVATPGRLLDIFNQKKLSFRAVEFFVLDEADRMLDMGFIHDIRRICRQLPGDRQSMLFSATLGSDVQSIAAFIVNNPVKISVNPESPTVDKIEQKIYFVDRENKIALLKEVILKKFERDDNAIALVFCRTKHGANKVANRLAGKEFNAAVIHGNKSQSSRRRALQSFKDRESRVLVATDIAARGIDVKSMPLVVNFDLSEEPETYVHRIGRTARAESEGEAVSLCSEAEVPLARAIEKFIRRDIPCATDSQYCSIAIKNLKDSNKNIKYTRPSSGSQKRSNANAGVHKLNSDSKAEVAKENSSSSKKRNQSGAKAFGKRAANFHSTKSNPAKFQIPWMVRKRMLKARGGKKS